MTNSDNKFNTETTKAGFTLVELMVSVSLFLMVMAISMGSILSVLNASRKSQSIRAVMDNLNYSLESMTRAIRFGTSYHCNINVTTPPLSSPNNCPSGASSIVFTAQDGSVVTYNYDSNNKKITRTVNGVTQDVTSSDVTINNLVFRVQGAIPYASGVTDPQSCPNTGQVDLCQPLVVITVNGQAGTKTGTISSFTLQTTVSQRRFDVQ